MKVTVVLSAKDSSESVKIIPSKESFKVQVKSPAPVSPDVYTLIDMSPKKQLKQKTKEKAIVFEPIILRKIEPKISTKIEPAKIEVPSKPVDEGWNVV